MAVNTCKSSTSVNTPEEESYLGVSNCILYIEKHKTLSIKPDLPNKLLITTCDMKKIILFN